MDFGSKHIFVEYPWTYMYVDIRSFAHAPFDHGASIEVGYIGRQAILILDVNFLST